MPKDPIDGVTYRFEKGVNEFLGVIGWQPVGGLPDPVPPVMMVHDILEHFPDTGGEVSAEYMALGASHHLRGQGGFFGEDPNRISAQLGGTPFQMLFHHITTKGLVTDPTDDPEALKPIEDPSVEMMLLGTVTNARNTQVQNFADRHKTELLNSLSHGLCWMRLGYRRATQRYAGYDIRRISRLWLALQREMDDLTNLVAGVDGERNERDVKDILEMTIFLANYHGYARLVQERNVGA